MSENQLHSKSRCLKILSQYTPVFQNTLSLFHSYYWDLSPLNRLAARSSYFFFFHLSSAQVSRPRSCSRSRRKSPKLAFLNATGRALIGWKRASRAPWFANPAQLCSPVDRCSSILIEWRSIFELAWLLRASLCLKAHWRASLNRLVLHLLDEMWTDTAFVCFYFISFRCFLFFVYVILTWPFHRDVFQLIPKRLFALTIL